MANHPQGPARFLPITAALRGIREPARRRDLAAGVGVALALSAMLALLIGAILVVAGLIRLGFIAEFLSRPVLLGYIMGVALTVISSQLEKIFGFKVDGSDFSDERGASLATARMKTPVRQMLDRAGRTEPVREEQEFATVREAVAWFRGHEDHPTHSAEAE